MNRGPAAAHLSEAEAEEALAVALTLGRGIGTVELAVVGPTTSPADPAASSAARLRMKPAAVTTERSRPAGAATASAPLSVGVDEPAGNQETGFAQGP
ncbi:hypothetical protein AMTR_s00081p00033090 [Amborella trichopoda]|uniref:Uncharacterized protein n=1 Tax=Amborella trichopoda TaxID=13333 RepID=W1PBS0_AMBTC|nr:hypothetical protein AMTR_s00081p00033090 [Amborella trichopoda]